MYILVLAATDTERAVADRLSDNLAFVFGNDRVLQTPEKFIRPGDDFYTSIANGMKNTDVLLLVHGESGLGSWVHDTNNYAYLALKYSMEGQTRIIPITVDGAAALDTATLPSEFDSLARRRGFNISSLNFREDAATIVESLKSTIPAVGAAGAPAAVMQGTPPPTMQSTPPPAMQFPPQANQGFGAVGTPPPMTPPNPYAQSSVGGFPPSLPSQPSFGQGFYAPPPMGQMPMGGASMGQPPMGYGGFGQPPMQFPMAGAGSLADFGTRLLAFLIDGFLLGVAGFVLGIVYSIIFPAPELSDYYYYYSYSSYSGYYSYSDYDEAVLQWQIPLYLLALGLSIVYHLFFLTQQQGQTPGKKAMNIRIVKENGQPLTIGDAFLRNVIGYFISSLIFYLGFLWIAFDQNKQGWHDKIAKTRVIKTR